MKPPRASASSRRQADATASSFLAYPQDFIARVNSVEQAAVRPEDREAVWCLWCHRREMLEGLLTRLGSHAAAAFPSDHFLPDPHRQVERGSSWGAFRQIARMLDAMEEQPRSAPCCILTSEFVPDASPGLQLKPYHLLLRVRDEKQISPLPFFRGFVDVGFSS